VDDSTALVLYSRPWKISTVSVRGCEDFTGFGSLGEVVENFSCVGSPHDAVEDSICVNEML
jgi:hypothetical protein